MRSEFGVLTHWGVQPRMGQLPPPPKTGIRIPEQAA